MKRFLWLFSALAFTVFGVSCQTATDSSTPTVQQSSDESTSGEFTVVTLNVPNMT